MKGDCNFWILAENEHGYIGQCYGCNEYSFAYKNLLLTFTEEHLFIFCEWLITNVHNPNFLFELPHSKTRIYRSPAHNVYLAFCEQELEEISQLFNEAHVLMEAHKIISYRH